MTPSLDHRQHRAAQRRSGGGSIWAAVNAAPSVIDNQNQSRAVLSARSFRLRAVTQPRALHCPGTPGTFYTIAGATSHRQGGSFAALPRGRAATHSHAVHNGLHRLCIASPTRCVAVQLSAALEIGRSHQLNRIGNKLGRYLAYPLHNLERLSCLAGFDDQNRDIRKVVNVQQGVGENRYV